MPEHYINLFLSRWRRHQQNFF